MLAGTILLIAAVAAGNQPAQGQGRPQAPPIQARRRTADEQRRGIQALEQRLDRAIGRVSLPHAARLLGRESARSYRLPGYGLVLVLPPRALPGAPGFVYRLGGHGRLLHVGPRPPGEPDLPAEVESVERQVLILQQETEQTRQAAERDMERIVHDVRVRLAAPDQAPGPEPAAGVTPASAEPATTPAGEARPVTDPLPPPPWKFWFETTPHDERKPEAVVADVRRAVVEALASQTEGVPGLAPDESVTVAVDFEPSGAFATGAAPSRTLIVRARVRDLEARARGALAGEELRRRLEISEY